jgi:galactonate dehydratase
MKITALETIRIAEFVNLLWLKVHTSEGIVGLGETFFLPETVEALRPRKPRAEVAWPQSARD